MYEWLIQTVKKTLHSLSVGPVNLETFRTLVTVTAGIVNRRPLTRFSEDPNDFRPLTPMDLLQPGAFIHSSNIVLPATPLTGSELRRSKDRLRPLLDALWRKWRTDYVMTLQQRSNWHGRKLNLRVNDLVLLTDETAP